MNPHLRFCQTGACTRFSYAAVIITVRIIIQGLVDSISMNRKALCFLMISDFNLEGKRCQLKLVIPIFLAGLL